jgi:hemerythrin
MVAIEWSAAHEIGLVPMYRTHREFVALYNNLVHAGSADFLENFNKLIVHTLAHFDRENAWMERSGFPPSVIHRGEHDRVLRLMHAARDRIAAGDVESGREFGAQLPAWFEQHAATMDAALAMHMRRARFEPDDPATAAA